jgi:hypothetical protein
MTTILLGVTNLLRALLRMPDWFFLFGGVREKLQVLRLRSTAFRSAQDDNYFAWDDKFAVGFAEDAGLVFPLWWSPRETAGPSTALHCVPLRSG